MWILKLLLKFTSVISKGNQKNIKISAKFSIFWKFYVCFHQPNPNLSYATPHFKTNTDYLCNLASKQQNPFYFFPFSFMIDPNMPSFCNPLSAIWITYAQVIHCLLNLYIQNSTVYINDDQKSILVLILSVLVLILRPSLTTLWVISFLLTKQRCVRYNSYRTCNSSTIALMISPKSSKKSPHEADLNLKIKSWCHIHKQYQILPNEERQITIWQIYSPKTRQDSHHSNTNNPNSTD